MARRIVTGIDIGVESIQTMIAEWNEQEQRMVIRGIGEAASEGVRRGDIIDEDAVCAPLKKSIEGAMHMAGTNISSAFFSYGGTGLESLVARGLIVLPYASGGEITERDVERALDASYTSIVPHHNKEVIHRFPIVFRVDKDLVTRNPVGMSGSRLEVETLFVMALSQHIERIVRCAERAGIGVDTVIASPLAVARAALSKHKREVGVMALDIGAGTMGAAVFEEGLPISVHTFPIGAQAITHDIAIGFRIGLHEAEKQKHEYKQFRGQSKKQLEEIITARVKDMFETVDGHLRKIGRDGLLPAGVVLSGGGAHLADITLMGKHILKLPVEVQRILEGAGIDEQFDPRLATVAGLCLFAFGSDVKGNTGVLRGISHNTGSFLWRWLKAFLP